MAERLNGSIELLYIVLSMLSAIGLAAVAESNETDNVMAGQAFVGNQRLCLPLASSRFP